MRAWCESPVRQQFERQFAHYRASSPMADRTVLDAIAALAPVQPGQRLLDVACGAGFLLRTYQELGAEVFGVDLSDAMLRAARSTLGPIVPAHHLVAADACDLPFACEAFDVVTCKLAFHYFAEPQRALVEMGRVCRRSGLIVVIDRVTSDHPAQCAAQNRLEKLRTPNKVRVYRERELVELLQSTGLTVVRRCMVVQPTSFAEWMSAAGAGDRNEQAKALLFGPIGEDLTGLAPEGCGDSLTIRHRTLILVATFAKP